MYDVWLDLEPTPLQHKQREHFLTPPLPSPLPGSAAFPAHRSLSLDAVENILLLTRLIHAIRSEAPGNPRRPKPYAISTPSTEHLSAKNTTPNKRHRSSKSARTLMGCSGQRVLENSMIDPRKREGERYVSKVYQLHSLLFILSCFLWIGRL